MDFKFKKSNLNFRVYTSETEPIEPGLENDIAIITSVPMSNWILSPDEPSGAPRSEGDVWIKYSVNGSTFNALKQGSMMIATISAWQYVNGAWVDSEAKSYQNGVWVDWITFTYIVGEGSQVSFSADNCKCAVSGSGLAVTPNGSSHSMKFYTTNKYDLTGMSRIVISGMSGNAKNDNYGPYLGVFTETPYFNGRDNNAVRKAKIPQNGNAFTGEEFYLDISGLSAGNYYIGCIVESCDVKVITIPEWKMG